MVVTKALCDGLVAVLNFRELPFRIFPKIDYLNDASVKPKQDNER